MTTKYPFWLVTEAKERDPPDKQPCGELAVIYAFTSWTLLTEFLSDREADKWELSLVPDGEALFLALADLHHIGVIEICFDSKSNGPAGELVLLSDMLRLAIDGRSEARNADGSDLLL